MVSAAAVGVRPRPDDERDVDIAVAQSPVLLQRLVQEHVLPAAHQQDRDAGRLQRRTDPARPPVLGGRVGVLDPRPVPGRAAGEHTVADVADRQPAQFVAEPPRRGHGARQAPKRPAGFLVGDLEVPAERVAQGERAGSPHDLAEVVRSHDDRRGGQLGRRVDQQRPLREAEVGGTDRREASVEPGLLTQPGDRVGAVVHLVPARVELAARAETASRALQYDVITVGGVQAGEDFDGQPAPAVRPAHQHGADWLPSGDVAVGEQDDAVAHRYFQITFDAEVGVGCRQSHPAGEDPDPEGGQRTGCFSSSRVNPCAPPRTQGNCCSARPRPRGAAPSNAPARQRPGRRPILDSETTKSGRLRPDSLW